jgi:cytochrome P450
MAATRRANTNIVSATFWAVVDIFRNPTLLAQVRGRLPRMTSIAEVGALLADPALRQHICSDHLLQSIYAETLRLRVYALITRQFPHENIDVEGKQVPKNALCLVATQPAHYHGSEWNTDGGKQSLATFWPYRFLVLEQSQSLLNAAEMGGSDSTALPPYDSQRWTFSTKGLEGTFIPYGGGSLACPGRHLAKHHMLITMAAWVLLFDVEVLAGEKAFTMDLTNYGYGTMHPEGKIPCKVRRRF